MCTYPVWGRHVWWQYPHSEWLVLHCGSSDRQQTSWTWHADHVAFQIQQPHNLWHRSPWWIEVHHNKPCQVITRNFYLKRNKMLHIFDKRFGPLKLLMSNNIMTSYLRTASPPISLYLRDSHCAMAHRPLVATFSAYNYKKSRTYDQKFCWQYICCIESTSIKFHFS